jgi:hypothetical protein
MGDFGQVSPGVINGFIRLPTYFHIAPTEHFSQHSSPTSKISALEVDA